MDGYESPSERFRNHNIREGLRYRIFVVKRQYHPFVATELLDGVRSSAAVTLALFFQTAKITPILIFKLPMFTEHLGEHPLTSDSV